MKLSNQPPRGTSDWLPEEFKIRKYIMDTWRKVCVSFGYLEYLTPIIEKAEIYKAKSGEDIGEKELMIFKELAIRPEMTPSVTRLISKTYREVQKPIRYFSIANFWRNEKPQKGRNREFWLLNYDCFGSTSINADIEIIKIAIEIMLAFSAPKNSFKVRINDRNLIDAFLSQVLNIKEVQIADIIRLMDKWAKLSQEEITKQFKKLGLGQDQIDNINIFMDSKTCAQVKEKFPTLDNAAFSDINEVLETLKELGYNKWIEFGPNIIRGFDYYNGIVFEVFDQNAKSSRSLFGGGRYNGLGKIFGVKDVPAVGCAPGDETMKIFLENWGLLDKVINTEQEKYYLPILSQDKGVEIKTLKLAQSLRKKGKIVEVGLAMQKINKALDYANKRNITKVIIFGEDENSRSVYKIKNMKTGTEEEINF